MCVSVIDSVSGVWPFSVICCSSLPLSFHTSFLSLSLSCYIHLSQLLLTPLNCFYFSLPLSLSITHSLSSISLSFSPLMCSLGLCPPPPHYYIQNKHRKFLWKMLWSDSWSERWYERELYHIQYKYQSTYISSFVCTCTNQHFSAWWTMLSSFRCLLTANYSTILHQSYYVM